MSAGSISDNVETSELQTSDRTRAVRFTQCGVSLRSRDLDGENNRTGSHAERDRGGDASAASSSLIAETTT